MMSKTHITVGIATSLAVCRPNTLEGIFASVLGGAAGGILCDIECRSSPGMKDALYGRLIALGLGIAILIADWITNAGIWASILSQNITMLIVGCIVLIATCVVGRFSPHRTFTHSLLFCFLITFGFYCLTPTLLGPVLAAGISHLIIDTFNKMPVPWLFPFKKGFCLKLCYAKGVANTVLMIAGLVASIALLIWRITIIA